MQTMDLNSARGASPLPDLYEDLKPPGSPTLSSKSTFGPQVLSQRTTGPTTLFGTAERVRVEKLYIDRDLNKTIPGNNSPGPIYNFASSIGKQVESPCGTAPVLTFPRAHRWRSRRSMNAPGPGAYDAKVAAFGDQFVSSLRSPEKTDFGKATREQENKIVEKSRHFSPGPVVCDERSSLGPQIHSVNATAPKITFGHERRFRRGPTSVAGTPGAGRYGSVGSVGRQHESKKASSPAYSIGSTSRQQREKVFLSKEHDKSYYGLGSPGPAGNIKTRSSLGYQPNSRNSSASAFKFGSERRFKPFKDDRPGPGAYNC